jgi:hypothetical protein
VGLFEILSSWKVNIEGLCSFNCVAMETENIVLFIFNIYYGSMELWKYLRKLFEILSGFEVFFIVLSVLLGDFSH